MTTTTTTTAQPAADRSAGLQVWRSALTLTAEQQHLCLDVQELHRLVMRGFRNPRTVTGTHSPRPAGILFAARRSTPLRDPDTRRLSAGTPEQILVQSPQPPNWSHLLTTGTLTAATTNPVREHYTTGDIVEARTVANPVAHDRQTGRILGKRTAEECGEWLRGKLHQHGLDINPQHITMSEGQSVTGMHGDHAVKFIVRETFLTGIVTDSDKFHTLLTGGFGRAKAYGCGLLLSRPVE
ncbi:type I-E CRISPR-associated protein Cas6/Cse3/CasE [Streptomyces sp. CA-111067]|uniref:type I-E CRISPR-associated protein Cas6/Cse3/CasE n=1 Tax=Streptomyces sp. CA-111067 TaxID=3240046 RepID=UPI003D999D96